MPTPVPDARASRRRPLPGSRPTARAGAVLVVHVLATSMLAGGAAVGLAVGLGAASVTPAAASASPSGPDGDGVPPDATDPAGAGCDTPVFAEPVRAAVAARRGGPALAVAERRNEARGVDLADVAADADAWLDSCGRAFYLDRSHDVDPAPVDPAAEQHAEQPGAEVQPAALGQTFELRSRPGSARTIYLDFTGGVVTGTAWNSRHGDSITVEPYSRDGDPSFSDSELLDVQQTWALVAADYAPFDVDVTTRWPGQDALTRSSASDPTYGSHVRITNGGVVYDACGCGGAAYVNAIAPTRDHAYTQPAFVFARGTGTSGKAIGEAASHEVGHHFGLGHDGAGAAGYYSGSRPWAPIMGVGYHQPVTQWSRGEYAGATNTEDDLSIIARSAPLISDDHGGTRNTATMLPGPGREVGRITSRGDTDAFTFTGAGKTTFVVAGGAWSNLDVSLRVLDESGGLVTTVDPAATYQKASSATGLDAAWTTVLPATGATRTVVVDGAGHGTVPGAGAYSDYASLGPYVVDLATGTPAGAADLLRTAASAAPAAIRGRGYAARPVTAEGGRPPYTWSATGLPPGLRVASATGALSGAATTAGRFSVTVRVADADGRVVDTLVTLSVADDARLVMVTGATALPVGNLGRDYRGTVRTRGAQGTLAWRRVRGTLPPGLRLGPNTGSRLVITGVPRRPVTRTVVLSATDAAGRTVRRGFRVRVVQRG